MKKFALAGNPNCGKTTLFNALTGSTAYVGNWPGVTVDKREGYYKKLDETLDIVDLPGIYSLSPYTPEEVISRNFILDEKPDCVINIIDATNLERNLYLTTQLLEIDVPIVIALNMMDAVEKNGQEINVPELEKRFRVPIVPISALKSKNLDSLMKKAYQASKEKRTGYTVLAETPVKSLIEQLTEQFKKKGVDNPLFHAIKLAELDELEVKNHPELVEDVNKAKETFSDPTFGNDFEAVIADARYRFISSRIKGLRKQISLDNKNVKKDKKTGVLLSKSDRIDKILTNKYAGIPIFITILFLIFHLTFSENFLYLGGIFEAKGIPTNFEGVPIVEGLFYTDAGINSPGVMLANLLNGFTDWLSSLASQGLENANVEPWASGFIVDGVLAGLFSVMSFLPQILVLFLFFSILEDSGYMARVAFILDRIFRRFGLSGRAFLPMIMGFGCSVPAMINTRTLADANERTATIRVIPFFSCGAKLPILTAIAGCLANMMGFGNADIITLSMYILGMLTAIVAVLIMRNTVMRGDIPPFIMELPTYHLPQFKALMIHLWDKLKHFVKKAFTIILVSCILIWAISHLSWNWTYLEDNQINESIVASLGMFVRPIFTPLGFGSQLSSTWGWVFVVAAITGLIAKENVIGTFGILAACIVSTFDAEADPDGIEAVYIMIQNTGITTAGLIAFIAFNMLTIPCFAAVSTAKSELPDHKFKGTLVFWVVTSYIVSSTIYLIGNWWWTLFIILPLFGLATYGIYYYNKRHPIKKDA